MKTPPIPPKERITAKPRKKKVPIKSAKLSVTIKGVPRYEWEGLKRCAREAGVSRSELIRNYIWTEGGWRR